MKKIFLLLQIVIYSFTVFSQEMGKPVLRFYSPKEYGAHNQNWDIVQDNRGIMYFANSASILEYDGAEWRKIKIPNKSVVRSIEKDSLGRIFVGAVRDFGYLAPDSAGKMIYKSLSSKLDTSFQDFDNVWEIVCASDGVYFRTRKFLFKYNYNKQGEISEKPEFKIWKPENTFQRLFYVNNVCYIQERNKGLLKIVKDSLKLIQDNGLFKKNKIRSMMYYNKNKIIICLWSGLYLYSNKKNIHKDSVFREFNTELNDFFQKIKYTPAKNYRTEIMLFQQNLTEYLLQQKI
jgi:hypothetical protein